jgi:hypothetical protein
MGCIPRRKDSVKCVGSFLFGEKLDAETSFAEKQKYNELVFTIHTKCSTEGVGL